MKFRNILLTVFIFAASFSNVFAQFNNISTSAYPATGGTTVGDGFYFTGAEVTLEATSNVGYTFVNWTENSLEVSTDSIYSFSANTNRTLIANFELKSYLIESSSEPIEGGSIDGAGSYIYGSAVNLEATSNVGYTFVNWTENSLEISTDSLYSFLAKTNRTLIANFELKSYLIESASEPLDGGNIIGAGSFIHGSAVNLEAIPNVGYSFVNWTENSLEVSTDSLYSFSANKNRTLIANFELKSYLIESASEPIEGGLVNGAGQYIHGTDIILEAIPNVGYSFISWKENEIEISSDSILTFKADANRSINANFTLNNYQVITSANPLVGGITSGSGTFTHGELVSVIATPASGYFFQSWTESDTLVSSDSLYSFNIIKNRNLQAIFSEKQFVVTTTINPPLSGIVKGDSTYTNLSLVNLIASSNIGWRFINWSENNNALAVDSNYSFIIFEDKNLIANFTKLIYNITASSFPAEGGTVFGEGNYTHDSVVTMIPFSSPGYSFTCWSENDTIVSTDSLFTFNILGRRNLIANYSKKTFAIQTESNPSNAGITYGDSLYTYGDNVSISAIPDSNSGWEFANWSENGFPISSDTIYAFIADTNHNIVANFKLKNYSVDLIPYPSNAGSVDGLGTYTHGEDVTVKAVPQSGWFFANWTDGQNNISDECDLTFTIDEDKMLIANFAHELYSINSSAVPSEAGYVSGSGTFYYNQAAILTPIANPGWEFINWTENDKEISADSLLSLNIIENMNLVANFKMVNYSINCSVSPAEAGYTSGCGISRYNQEMTIIATPNKGWEFINWTENGDTVSALIDYEFSVINNRNVVANFQLITSIDLKDNQDIVPNEFYLSNAYPNPFNPSTNINFGLPVTSNVKITVSNINGEIVQTILDNKSLSAGSYSEQFNAENLTSGIYFYIISAQAENSEENFRKVGKMILLK